jgi:hypothetical protein
MLFYSIQSKESAIVGSYPNCLIEDVTGPSNVNTLSKCFNSQTRYIFLFLRLVGQDESSVMFYLRFEQEKVAYPF